MARGDRQGKPGTIVASAFVPIAQPNLTAMPTPIPPVTRHHGSMLLAAWECWLGASDLACQVTYVAWSWYLEAVFSEAAQGRYRWLGEMLACLAMLAYLAGRLSYLRLTSSLDAFVEACQGTAPLARDGTPPAPANPMAWTPSVA
ncbi:MAG: hypothetical protein KGQ93_13880 [Cyanobacteria bacterium REEB459]|nr:hypothetical protein [Cyanobacteria bacterium REEB459]